jgi:polyphenol oxidase
VPPRRPVRGPRLGERRLPTPVAARKIARSRQACQGSAPSPRLPAVRFSVDGSPKGLAWLNGVGRTRRIETPILSDVPGLIHLFTVKGSDTHAAIAEAAGRDRPLLTLRQVHGAMVVVGSSRPETPEGAAPPQGDALIVQGADALAGVWTADCLSILICDERTRTVAAVHAGWRGTVAGVLPAAIEKLRAGFGAGPAGLRLAMGPAIGPCCFEVGDEVVEALVARFPDAADCVVPGPKGSKKRVDLVEVNRRQAVTSGVPESSIQSTGLCTLCRPDLLESYRRSGASAGRMAGIIGWRD